MSIRISALAAIVCTGYVNAEVKRPYKVIENQVVYQKYSNIDPIFLEGAKVDDFAIKYKNSDITVAESNGYYYCNSTRGC